MTFNPFSILTSKIYGGIAIAALTFAAVQTVRIEGFLFFDGYKQEVTNLRASIAAGQANLALLEAEKTATEDRQAQITKDTNHATQPARDSALDAARRYAAAHRCMSPAAVAAAGPASAGLPEPSATPGSPETPSEAVAVPEWGVTNCALNSADLQTAYEWAQRTYGSN